jgi:hypothetical protein
MKLLVLVVARGLQRMNNAHVVVANQWTAIREQRIRSAAFLSAFFLFLSGCASSRYQAPVSSFRNKTQQTVTVLADFYSSRNSYEVDLYLQGVLADPSLSVEAIDTQGIPTPLGKPVFSPGSIKARLDALNLVGAYADRLYDLANTDAPSKFQSAATTLGQNLSSLDKTFQTLQGASDPTANKYIGPISSLVGTIGEMYLDRKRDELLQKGINDGAKQVDVILGQVRDDMDKIFSQQLITGSNEKLAILVVAYNNNRRTLTYEQRSARLAEIKAASNEASASVGSDPSSLVTSMMGAHKALVQAAASTKRNKPMDLQQLNAAIEEWTNQIQTISAQVKLLIH